MLTLLSCGQGQNGTYIDFLINQLKARTLTEGGVFEAEQCLRDTLTTLNNI